MNSSIGIKFLAILCIVFSLLVLSFFAVFLLPLTFICAPLALSALLVQKIEE